MSDPSSRSICKLSVCNAPSAHSTPITTHSTDQHLTSAAPMLTATGKTQHFGVPKPRPAALAMTPTHQPLRLSYARPGTGRGSAHFPLLPRQSRPARALPAPTTPGSRTSSSTAMAAPRAASTPKDGSRASSGRARREARGLRTSKEQRGSDESALDRKGACREHGTWPFGAERRSAQDAMRGLGLRRLLARARFVPIEMIDALEELEVSLDHSRNFFHDARSSRYHDSARWQHEGRS